jgi:hypothetical protein
VCQQFQLATYARHGADERIFDDRLGFAREAGLDWDVARKREPEYGQFGAFSLGRLEGNLGETALNRGELPLGIGQSGCVKPFCDKIAAKSSVVAEIGDRQGGIRHSFQNHGEFGWIDTPCQSDRRRCLLWTPRPNT